MAKNSEFEFTTSQIRGSAFTQKGAGHDALTYHDGGTTEYITHTHSQPLMCSSSISYKYPWTIGAAYPTTVPHSQSHAARSPAHLDAACQSHSTYPALCHGISPGGTMGGLGRQHSRRGDGAARPRPHPGKQQDFKQYYARPPSATSKPKRYLGHNGGLNTPVSLQSKLNST